jgi:hypothetical protein
LALLYDTGTDAYRSPVHAVRGWRVTSRRKSSPALLIDTGTDAYSPPMGKRRQLVIIYGILVPVPVIETVLGHTQAPYLG